MPYRTTGLYDGKHPTEISYGAYLGWKNSPVILDRLVELANGDGSVIAEAGLFDIENQVAGHNCSGAYYVARPVTLAPDKVSWAASLCGDYYHHWGGWFAYFRSEKDNIEFSNDFAAEVAAYRQRLAGIGLTARRALGPGDAGLCEAVYPIDASDDNLALLLADAPSELRGMGRFAQDPLLRDQMVLVLLADNSD